MQSLTLTRPDDWHLHVRDGALLADVLPHSARQFARAIIMPNLKPPVTTVAAAHAYRERILAVLPQGARFEPLMTLYLTDDTAPTEIAAAQASGFVHAVKYYPAGATTNSAAGITALERVYGALAAMEEHDLPLLMHGEVTTAGVDIYDREKVFIDTVLTRVLQRFPQLRVVFEHITTREAAQFVLDAGANVGATITVQHLLYSRNALFEGGLRPHRYCLPVLKRERHRVALIEAATGNCTRFFLGTDSAPHAQADKESGCGCAGCYTAPVALELYAQVFEAAGALDRLEAFAAFNGADFYRLPRNEERITLVREPWRVPADYVCGDAHIVPLCAGETLAWHMR